MSSWPTVKPRPRKPVDSLSGTPTQLTSSLHSLEILLDNKRDRIIKLLLKEN